MYARAISLFHLFYIDWHWKENCSLFPQAYQFIIDTTANCTFRHRNLNAHFALLRCTVSGTVHQFQLRFINADLQRLVRSCAKTTSLGGAANAFATSSAIFRDSEPLLLGKFSTCSPIVKDTIIPQDISRNRCKLSYDENWYNIEVNYLRLLEIFSENLKVWKYCKKLNCLMKKLNCELKTQILILSEDSISSVI